MFTSTIIMGKKCDLSDFDRGMIVGARRAGLSISKTADLLGFSRTTVSRVYSEWYNKEKTSSERQSCGRKRLVDETGQQRMATLFRADRKATVTQITTLYNCGEQKSISECTARRTLRRMGCNTRRPRRVPLLSAKNKSITEGLSISSIPHTRDHLLNTGELIDTGDSGAVTPMTVLETGGSVVCMSNQGEELMPSIQEALSSDILTDMETVLSASRIDKDSLLTWL